MDNGKNTRPNLVAAAILKAQEAEAGAKAQRQALVKERLAMMRRMLAPYVEKLRESGATIEEAEYATQNEDKDVAFYQYPVSLPGFARFWLIATPHGPDTAHLFFQNHSQGSRDYPLASHRMVQVVDETGFGKLLLERQAAYQKMEQERQEKQAKERKAQAEKLAHRLENWNWPEFIADPAEAETVITQVAELAPQADIAALRRNWQEARTIYLNRQEQERERQEAAAAHKQLYDQKLAEFKRAHAAWRSARDSLWEINRERFPVLQEQHNQPFEVYELCYALFVPAFDEDGPYVEKESCDCLWPYQNGLHREIGRNGLVRPYRYSETHVYKIGVEREVRPVGYKKAGRYSLLDQLGEDVALCYVPGTYPEEIAAAVSQAFEPIPDEPQPDPILSYDDVQRVIRNLDPADNIPF